MVQLFRVSSSQEIDDTILALKGEEGVTGTGESMGCPKGAVAFDRNPLQEGIQKIHTLTSLPGVLLVFPIDSTH